MVGQILDEKHQLRMDRLKNKTIEQAVLKMFHGNMSDFYRVKYEN